MTLTQDDIDFLNQVLTLKTKDVSQMKRYLEIERKLIFNNNVVKRLKESLEELPTPCYCDDCIFETNLREKLQNILGNE